MISLNRMGPKRFYKEDPVAEEIKEFGDEYIIPLFDPHTGKQCVTKKVVDVTQECPKASEKYPALLIFTKITQGRFVQIVRRHKGRICPSPKVLLSIDEPEAVLRTSLPREPLSLAAAELGLSRSNLQFLIKVHAPAP